MTYRIFWVEVQGGTAMGEWQQKDFTNEDGHGAKEISPIEACRLFLRQLANDGSENVRLVITTIDEWDGVDKVLMVYDEAGVIITDQEPMPKECR